MTRRLHEDDAFALAIDWGHRLSRVADLELDPALSQSVPAFNRIRVRFEVGDAEMVTVPMTCDAWSILRETLGVWRALTCCRGFSWTENPTFWDRVVRELKLQLAVNECTCLQLPLDESLETSMSTAIRLTLCVSVTAIDEGRPPQSVFTLEGGFENYAESCKSDARKTQRARDFQSAWHRLKPFFDEARVASLGPVNLALELEAYRYDPCTVFLRALPTAIDKIEHVATQTSDGKRDTSTYLRLQELKFRDWRVASTEQLLDLTSLLSTLPVHLASLSTCIETLDCEDEYSRFVRSALGLKQLAKVSGSPPWRPTPDTKILSQPRTAKILQIMYERLEARHVIALFSALPYTQRVKELQLGSDNSDSPLEFSGFLAAWIGYAVFHPQSHASSWRKLALLHWRGSDRAANKQLIQMIVNPLEMLSMSKLAAISRAALNRQHQDAAKGAHGDCRAGEPETIPFAPSTLQLAQLKSGTEVRASRHADAPVWITLQGELTLEVCKPVGRHGSSNAHVCALVPGYGFGWVAKSAVKSTKEWVVDLPLTSPLQDLKCYCEDFPEITTSLLLRAFGANLTSLSLVLDPLDPHIFDVAAHACPGVQHLGAVSASSRDRIAQDSLTRMLSRSNSPLRSLALSWDVRIVKALMKLLVQHKSDAHTRTRLKKLHISSVESLDELRETIGAIEHMLQTNKSLEQFILTTRFSDANAEEDAVDEYARLRAFDGETLTRFAPLRQRLAFVSVVHTRAAQCSDSVYRDLNAELIATVFAFANPRLQRQVAIFREPRMT